MRLRFEVEYNGKQATSCEFPSCDPRKGSEMEFTVPTEEGPPIRVTVRARYLDDE